MHAWYHQKDYLILFKMIPFCYDYAIGERQYFKIWDKVSIEKLQNEHQWSWRVNKERVLLCGVMSFVLSWSAHQQQHEDAVTGLAVLQALRSSTRYWALIRSLKSMNIDEIKDPCDNKHENPCRSNPCATSFVYVVVVVNVVNVLWD